MELPRATPKTRAGLAFEAYTAHKALCRDCRHRSRCAASGLRPSVRCERGDALEAVAVKEISAAMPRAETR